MPDVLIAVGTRKGLFLGWSQDRHAWKWEGPHLAMQPIAAVAIDTRPPVPRLLVGGRDENWVPAVLTSDDLGVSWSEPKASTVAFPADVGAHLQQIWQLQPGPGNRPDEVWAGVEPAAVFRSTDGGSCFRLIDSLWNHPDRKRWRPGGGGLCLHTVVPHLHDVDSTLVAISGGGIYRTTDGGTSWAQANEGIAATSVDSSEGDSSAGAPCVHKVAADPQSPDLLLALTHGGVVRSANWGDSWQPADAGLPTTFGFGIARTVAGASLISPLVSETRRFPRDGRCAVFRTDDNGQSWHDSSRGLPSSGFHTVVLRDALTSDRLDPEGVYFGTRSGEVWASPDTGGEWFQVASHFPDILCVRAASAGPSG